MFPRATFAAANSSHAETASNIRATVARIILVDKCAADVAFGKHRTQHVGCAGNAAQAANHLEKR
jgi:hypothetical protein